MVPFRRVQHERRLAKPFNRTRLGSVESGACMKSLDLNEATRRREFFRAALRYGALGVVAAAAAVLARPRAPAPAGQRCENQGICRGCGVFSECGLPQALSAKRARTDG
jgi:hypothetical protein